MTFKVKNNASSTVEDNPLTSGALILNVAPGGGSEFPIVGNYRLTIWDSATYSDPDSDPGMEIVECISRSVDELEITRGHENTLAAAHTQGEKVALLITAGIFDDSSQGVYNMDIDGGTF